MPAGPCFGMNENTGDPLSGGVIAPAGFPVVAAGVVAPGLLAAGVFAAGALATGVLTGVGVPGAAGVSAQPDSPMARTKTIIHIHNFNFIKRSPLSRK